MNGQQKKKTKKLINSLDGKLAKSLCALCGAMANQIHVHSIIFDWLKLNEFTYIDIYTYIFVNAILLSISAGLFASPCKC